MESALRLKLAGGKFSNVGEKRSKTMASIRGRHNKTTERRLRMVLVSNGIKGWKLHSKDVFGTPDFYFSKRKLAIFVDGCFWHGCPECGHIPKTRSNFWKAKFERNQARAKRVRSTLGKEAVKILRIWEHELKDPARIKRLIKIITSS